VTQPTALAARARQQVAAALSTLTPEQLTALADGRARLVYAEIPAAPPTATAPASPALAPTPTTAPAPAPTTDRTTADHRTTPDHRTTTEHRTTLADRATPATGTWLPSGAAAGQGVEARSAGSAGSSVSAARGVAAGRAHAAATASVPAPGVDVAAAVADISALGSRDEVAAYLRARDRELSVPALRQIARGLGPTVSVAARSKADLHRNIVEGTAGFRERSAAMAGRGGW
jgi:hypothetical protein